MEIRKKKVFTEFTIQNVMLLDTYQLKTSVNSFFHLIKRGVSCAHLEVRDPIRGNDWSHSPFIRRSPSWRFPRFSSAVRQMSGDLDTVPRIISLSPLSLATDVTRETRSKWPLARNPDRSWRHRHASLKCFWPQPMTPWTTGIAYVTWRFNSIFTRALQ